MDYDVKDLSLAAAGKARIEWADQDMPVLASHPRALRGREAARRHARLARVCT